MSIKTNMYLDDLSYDIARELPRKVSSSQILRWVLKAGQLTDKQWEREMKRDKSLREAHEYMAPKIRRLLGADKT